MGGVQAQLADSGHQGKVIVAYEDTLSFGYGAEIVARIADELFEWLDAPVRRVAALDAFVAYHPDTEDVTLPQIDDLKKAIAACEKAQDYVSRDMLAVQLEDTEMDHAYFLEKQLRQIELVGLANYLQSQIGSGAPA